MRKRFVCSAAVLAIALATAACSSSGGNTGSAQAGSGVPTVSIMVGGIDKQIYLPYQLA